MTTAFLGLGSNVDAEANIRSAVQQLDADFEGLELSPIYRSRAVGFDGDDFINLVASVETGMDAMDLRDYLRRMEDEHGRRRNVPKFSDRVLDIDILLFGEEMIDTPELEVPRPEILEFAHVLRPLAELAPERLYPGTQRSLGEIWASDGDHEAGLEPMDAGFLAD